MMESLEAIENLDIVDVVKTVDDLVLHNDIDGLSLYILDNLPLVHVPLKHTFVPGIYVREMFTIAGTLLTGMVHLIESPYSLMTGRILMFTPEGGTITLEGGHSGMTAAGTRRVLYSFEDCHWINYHALSPKEEEARISGMSKDDLVDIIEGRIFEELEALPDRDGKTVFDIYKSKLEEALLCQD